MHRTSTTVDRVFAVIAAALLLAFGLFILFYQGGTCQ